MLRLGQILVVAAAIGMLVNSHYSSSSGERQPQGQSEARAVAAVEDAIHGSPMHLFGLGFSGTPTAAKLEDAVRQVGRLDVVNIFVAFNRNFPTQAVHQIRASGAVPMITWEPWDPQAGLHQETYSLSKLAHGRFDSYMAAFAEGTKNKLTLFRFAHEMNTNFYPWAIHQNGNTAAEYVKAWRHVHAVVDRHATKVRWVWSPNVLYTQHSTITTTWPGARYVDMIGLDGYNAGTAVEGGQWTLPNSLFGASLSELETLSSTIPIIICETGSSDSGGSKAGWVTHLMEYVSRQSRVSGVIWSEFPGRADWPLTTEPAAVQAMRKALSTVWPAMT